MRHRRLARIGHDHACQRTVTAQRGEAGVAPREHQRATGNFHSATDLLLLEIHPGDGPRRTQDIDIGASARGIQVEVLHLADECPPRQRDLFDEVQRLAIVDGDQVIARPTGTMRPVRFRDVEAAVIRSYRDIRYVAGGNGPLDLAGITVKNRRTRPADGDEAVRRRGRQHRDITDFGGERRR